MQKTSIPLLAHSPRTGLQVYNDPIVLIEVLIVINRRFDIDGTLWAEQNGDLVSFYRHPGSAASDQPDSPVLELKVDTLRNVVVWADQGRNVTASLTGPMASQVREAAKELGLTPEMFIWNAVKTFIEIGGG